VNDLVREFERVSPHDVFPEPRLEGRERRLPLHPPQARHREARSDDAVPGYNTDEIEKAIATYGNNGHQRVAQYRRRARPSRRQREPLPHRDEIEAVEYWGRSRRYACAVGLKDKWIKTD
jgi:hypothetical protein